MSLSRSRALETNSELGIFKFEHMAGHRDQGGAQYATELLQSFEHEGPSDVLHVSNPHNPPSLCDQLDTMPESPLDNSAPTTGSTPAKMQKKTAADLGDRSSYLSQSRQVVLSDLGRVPQIPLNAMMEMVLPSLLSTEEVDAILEDLEGNDIVTNGRQMGGV